MRTLALFFLLLVPAGAAAAGELAGVIMQDSALVGDETLVLNGMGLRKRAVFKVYVAGLYLPEKTNSAESILGSDTPRLTAMDFSRAVGAGQLCDAWKECLENNTADPSPELVQQFETLCGYMEDVVKADPMVFTYVPGYGTTVQVKGSLKGRIEGKPFADALWACWIGPVPPSEAFKQGLLGN